MKQPKFIITKDGYFRLGMVYQHRDLLLYSDICYGGGYYEFDYISNKIILHGASYDFGKPQWLSIDTLHVPEVYKGLGIIYRYSDGEIFNVSEHFTIDYYN